MQHPAICPACGQECETPLILPCSHSMCSRCVAAGGPMAPPLSVCSLLCPCCGRHVELPCWSWGAATSCLPKHPSMESERVSRQTSFWDDSPEDRPHHARVSCHGSLEGIRKHLIFIAKQLQQAEINICGLINTLE